MILKNNSDRHFCKNNMLITCAPVSYNCCCIIVQFKLHMTNVDKLKRIIQITEDIILNVSSQNTTPAFCPKTNPLHIIIQLHDFGII